MTHYLKPTIMRLHLYIDIYMIRQIITTTVYKSNISSSFSLWTGKQKAGTSKPWLMSVIQDIRAMRTTSGISMSTHILNFPRLPVALHCGQRGSPTEIKWLCHDTLLRPLLQMLSHSKCVCFAGIQTTLELMPFSFQPSLRMILCYSVKSQGSQILYGVTGFRVQLHEV